MSEREHPEKFSLGKFEVDWRHASKPDWIETSQVDAASADDAVGAVMDGDQGYGEVGCVVAVRELTRPEAEAGDATR